MVVKVYGLFDSVAKEFIKTFDCKNDEMADRCAHHIVRAPDFDKITGKDMIIEHVYDFDTATGAIVNNDVRVVCSLANAMALFEQEKLLNISSKKEVDVNGNN